MKSAFAILVMCCFCGDCFSKSGSPDLRSHIVTAVRFDSTGGRLAVGRWDGTVSLWKLKSKKELWESPPAPSAVGHLFLFFRRNDSQLIVVEKGGRVRVYDTVSGKLIKSLAPNFMAFAGDQPEGIAGADLDASGRILAIAGRFFGGVYLIDLDLAILLTGNELNLADWTRGKTPQVAALQRVLRGPTDDPITEVKIDLAGKFVAATTVSGFLELWRTDLNGPKAQSNKGSSEPEFVLRKVGDARNKFRALLGLACSKNFLLTVGDYSHKYGDFQMWTADTVEMIQHISGVDPGGAQHVAFDRTGQYAATTGDIRYALWRIANEKVEAIVRIYLKQSGGHDADPQAVDFSPSGPIVAIADLEGVFFVDVEKLRAVDGIGVLGRTLEILPFEEQPQ
jgi:WD40 repeat protein